MNLASYRAPKNAPANLCWHILDLCCKHTIATSWMSVAKSFPSRSSSLLAHILKCSYVNIIYTWVSSLYAYEALFDVHDYHAPSQMDLKSPALEYSILFILHMILTPGLICKLSYMQMKKKKSIVYLGNFL